MRFFASLFIALSVFAFSGCGAFNGGDNCSSTVVGPSCVGGKVSPNNPLPGPGGGVRASATYAVYEGDCTDDPSLCVRELSPIDDPSLQVAGQDKSYVLKSSQQFTTVRMCVTHPQVPGRKINIRLTPFFGSNRYESFDEGDPSKTSPYCVAISFRLMISGNPEKQGTGLIMFTEDNQDLFSSTEWKVTLGFKVSQ